MTNYRLARVCVLLVALGATPSESIAGDYKAAPGYHVTLGQGFDPFGLEDKSAANVFEWLSADRRQSTKPIGGGVKLEAEFTTSDSRVAEKLDANINANVKAGLFRAGIDSSFSRMVKKDNRTIFFVVRAWQKFHPESSGPIRLTAHGKVLLAATRKNDIRAFLRSAGSEVVTEIQKGTNIAVVYKFRSSRSELRDALMLKLNAEYGGSFKSSASFNQTMQSVDSRATWSYFVVQEGTVLHRNTTDKVNNPHGAKILQLLTTDPSNGPEILQTIREAAAADYDAAKVIAFATMRTANWLALTDAEIESLRKPALLGQQERRASRVAKKANELDRYGQVVRDLLDEAELSEKNRRDYEAILEVVEDREDRLATAVDNLRNAREETELPTLDEIKEIAPPGLSALVNAYDGDLFRQNGWRATVISVNAHLWKHTNGNAKFWPIVTGLAPALVERVTILRGDGDDGVPVVSIGGNLKEWPYGDATLVYSPTLQPWADNSVTCGDGRRRSLSAYEDGAFAAAADFSWWLQFWTIDGTKPRSFPLLKIERANTNLKSINRGINC